MKRYWTLIVGFVLLTSCGKEIPKDIIQPDMMEKVLYDYHLSMGMSNYKPQLDNVQKESYKKHLFKKFQITSELFDSSMVWYTRNAQELATIYENLDKRFKREHNHIELLLESRNETDTHISVSGDTVDIWHKENMYWLNETPLFNKITFNIQTDTTYHKGDTFNWTIAYHFFSEGMITMGFNIIDENDSIIGRTEQISQTGTHTIQLSSNMNSTIKSLNGYIYVLNGSKSAINILAHKISLIRYHRSPNDSLTISNVSTTSPKAIGIESKRIQRKQKE